MGCDVIEEEVVFDDVIGPILFITDQIDVIEVKGNPIFWAEFNENVLSLGCCQIKEVKVVDGLVE